MSEELRRIADKAEQAASTAMEAKQYAAQNKGLLESIQNQTKDQWERIENVTRTVERTATILERVVKDQGTLETKLASQDAINREQEKQINQAIGGASVFKWVAGLGGGAGLVAALKEFIQFPK